METCFISNAKISRGKLELEDGNALLQNLYETENKEVVNNCLAETENNEGEIVNNSVKEEQENDSQTNRLNPLHWSVLFAIALRELHSYT